MKPGKNPIGQDPFLASAMGLGLQLAVAMALCSFAGFKLDKKFNTSPMWLLIGIGFSFVYLGYEVWKIVKQNDKKENNDDRKTDK